MIQKTTIATPIVSELLRSAREVGPEYLIYLRSSESAAMAAYDPMLPFADPHDPYRNSLHLHFQSTGILP